MAKILFKSITSCERVVKDLSQAYPQVDAHSLATHRWMGIVSSSLEEATEHCLAKKGISSARFEVLMALEANKEGLRPSSIASAMGVTQATVTGLIDGLEKKGLVKRKAAKEDRRACAVALTAKGQKLIADCRPHYHEWVESIYSVWTLPEKKQLSALLEKFCHALKEHKHLPEA